MDEKTEQDQVAKTEAEAQKPKTRRVDELMAKLEADPRFRVLKPRGRGFAIAGLRQPRPHE